MPNYLIIGASSGIGAAIAEALPDDAVVYSASRNAEPGDRSIAWDASSGAFPEGFLPEKLHGLAYCPGTIRLAPFSRLDDSAFQDDFETCVVGAVRALRAALPAMHAADQASVVLFSTVAVGTGMPMHASVAAAKGAVEGLTRSLAAELAPGIRVNAVAPSLTDTPLAGKLLKTDRQRDAAAARHPLGRFGRAEDIAALSAFLLGPDASWITGQVIGADGGLGALRTLS